LEESRRLAVKELEARGGKAGRKARIYMQQSPHGGKFTDFEDYKVPQ
jgi:hypothetical protein